MSVADENSVLTSGTVVKKTRGKIRELDARDDGENDGKRTGH